MDVSFQLYAPGRFIQKEEVSGTDGFQNQSGHSDGEETPLQPRRESSHMHPARTQPVSVLTEKPRPLTVITVVRELSYCSGIEKSIAVFTSVCQRTLSQTSSRL
jgi:hypothetical protein